MKIRGFPPVFVFDSVYMKRLRFGMGICISSGNESKTPVGVLAGFRGSF